MTKIKTVDLCNKCVRKYIQAKDEKTQYKFIKKGNNKNYDTKGVFVSCKNKYAKLTVYSDENCKKNFACLVDQNKKGFTIYNLIPNTTYYIVIKADNKILKEKVIYTLNAPVRFIVADGGRNIRDEGGWATEDGKTVKYGMLYRGGCIDGFVKDLELTSRGKTVFNKHLKIKSEIDLRWDAQTVKSNGVCTFNKNAVYYRVPIFQYGETLLGFTYEKKPNSNENSEYYHENTQECLQNLFKFLADENNYPIYFHCNAGADRTGTVAFYVFGVLGVTYEDLTKDYEITTFSANGTRLRSDDTGKGFGTSGQYFNKKGSNYIAWDAMCKYLYDNYKTEDGKLSSAIKNYLVNHMGVKEEYIEKLKTIVLK